jgi:hypothetical protein
MAQDMLERINERRAAQTDSPTPREQRGQQRQADAQRAEFVAARTAPALKTRKPTGKVPLPLVLWEGEEKAGKSWALAEFSGDERVGRTFWLDAGEGSADEYGAVPGADFEIIDHDGTWGDILAQVEAVRLVAQAALDAGKPPVVLGIDSMTDLWETLSDWAYSRATRTETNKKKLAANPDVEIAVHPTFWNSANRRHDRLMRMLRSFPGIVIMTALGKEVAVMDSKGNPVEGRKEYRVEAQKKVAAKASLWVRVFRTQPPIVVGARSVKAGVIPGKDEPRRAPGLTLAKAIFEVLGCDPANAAPRDVRDLTASDESEQLTAARGAVWEAAQELGWDSSQLQADYLAWARTPIKDAAAKDLDNYLDQMPVPDHDAPAGADTEGR